MKKVDEGTINVEFSCDCPYCDEYINTGFSYGENLKKALERKSEHYFVDFASTDIENVIVECPECGEKFIVEKFALSI